MVLALCAAWTLSGAGSGALEVIAIDGFAYWFKFWVLYDLLNNVAVAATMGLPLVVVANLAPRSGWRRHAALAIAIALLAAVAAEERLAIKQWFDDVPFSLLPNIYSVSLYFRFFQFAALLTVIVEFNRYEKRNVEAMHAAEIDRLALEREVDEARLQVLQAQIEPHFLFNTLANVRRLYHTDLAAGRRRCSTT